MKIKGLLHEYILFDIQERKSKYFLAKARDESGNSYFVKYADLTYKDIALFYREANALNYLKKDYFVEFLKNENYIFLILKEIQGIPLQKVRFSSMKEKLELFIRVIDAVDELHKKNLVHLDLKPSNILIENGKVTIIDFSTARLLSEKEIPRFYTLPYAAPEILRKEGYDVSSDIYSLGVIFFELVTGQSLFAKMSKVEIRKKKMVGIDKKITQFKKVDRDFDYIFMRCTFLDRKMRYETTLKLKDDIQKLINYIKE